MSAPFGKPSFATKKPEKAAKVAPPPVVEEPVEEEFEDLEEDQIEEEMANDSDDEVFEDDEPQVEEKPTKKEKKKVSEDTEKKPRSQKMIDKECLEYVKANIKVQSYSEMAEHLGITTNQVNRILQTVKMGMRNYATQQDPKAYATKVNDKGETSYIWAEPKTELAKKVEEKILEKLSRPADSRPGVPGRKGDGKVQKVLDDEIANLLDEL